MALCPRATIHPGLLREEATRCHTLPAAHIAHRNELASNTPRKVESEPLHPNNQHPLCHVIVLLNLPAKDGATAFTHHIVELWADIDDLDDRCRATALAAPPMLPRLNLPQASSSSPHPCRGPGDVDSSPPAGSFPTIASLANTSSNVVVAIWGQLLRISRTSIAPGWESQPLASATPQLTRFPCVTRKTICRALTCKGIEVTYFRYFIEGCRTIKQDSHSQHTKHASRPLRRSKCLSLRGFNGCKCE